MSIIERYHKIFDKEILQKSRGVIFSFSPLQDQFIYQPYSHNISADSVEKLGELMRHKQKNIVDSISVKFSCFLTHMREVFLLKL